MSTQPRASVKTTLPQDRAREQLSSAAQTGLPRAEDNLWLQSLIRHAPLIGLGFGIATGLCLLMGIALRILLNPNIHAVTVPPADVVSPTVANSPNRTFQETDDTGVRIVFPAQKTFGHDSPLTSSENRTIALVLGIGGFGLTAAGFLLFRSIRPQATGAIVLHRSSSDLAPPASGMKSQLPTAIPSAVSLPPCEPSLSALPAGEIPVALVMDSPPLTIHYPAEYETADLDPDTTAPEVATGEPINLVDLMDIRKRRPHS